MTIRRAGWSFQSVDSDVKILAVNSVLIETLRQAQRFGFFGDRPIEDAVQHALDFVRPIATLAPDSRVVDLGSGGGLPGLVVADQLPHTSVVLIDRREKRADFLQQAVSRLGWSHVSVRCAEVSSLIREVREGTETSFELVTARGFGPADFTLRCAAALRSPTGQIVISDPPSGDRWEAPLLTELDLGREQHGSVAVFSSSEAAD